MVMEELNVPEEVAKDLLNRFGNVRGAIENYTK